MPEQDWTEGFRAGYAAGFSDGFRAAREALSSGELAPAAVPHKTFAKKRYGTATVTGKQQLSVDMSRVFAQAPDMVGLSLDKTDHYIKIFFGEQTRSYTLRKVDTATGEIAIDFFFHGDVGVAGPWARDVHVGETFSYKGPGGHTSRPHLSADVVYALGKVITELPALLSRRVDPRTGTVLVFGQVNSGYAPNAMPESGTLTGTMRTADIAIWRDMQNLFSELVDQVLAPVGVEHELTYHRGVPPVLNDDVSTALLASAAQAIDPQAVVQAPQSSGGEDFSWYLEHVPGSMARLGCWSGEGEQHDLHMGDLNVDERCIGVGIKLFGSVVEQFANVQE